MFCRYCAREPLPPSKESICQSEMTHISSSSSPCTEAANARMGAAIKIIAIITKRIARFFVSIHYFIYVKLKKYAPKNIGDYSKWNNPRVHPTKRNNALTNKLFSKRCRLY